MSKETKTAEEYYKEFYRLDEQGELTNQDLDIINCMQEYATIRLKAQEEKHKEEMEKFAEWKANIEKRNKYLFGEVVPNVYFKAVTSKNDDGWMQCDCGNSSIDGEDHYVVTTNNLKADEVPDLCTDSKTFAELVARLLNRYYNS